MPLRLLSLLLPLLLRSPLRQRALTAALHWKLSGSRLAAMRAALASRPILPSRKVAETPPRFRPLTMSGSGRSIPPGGPPWPPPTRLATPEQRSRYPRTGRTGSPGLHTRLERIRTRDVR